MLTLSPWAIDPSPVVVPPAGETPNALDVWPVANSRRKSLLAGAVVLPREFGAVLRVAGWRESLPLRGAVLGRGGHPGNSRLSPGMWRRILQASTVRA
jgi:hypothetical protein